MNLELKQALDQNRLIHQKFLNDFGLSWFAPAAEKMTDDELLLSAVQICNTFMCEEYDDTPLQGKVKKTRSQGLLKNLFSRR